MRLRSGRKGDALLEARANMYAKLGENDHAFAKLERAYENRS